MRRAVAGIWGVPAAEGSTALVVTTVFFVLGGLFGCLLAFRAEGGGGDALAIYLDQFLASAREGALTAPALPSLIWRCVRWPLAVFLCGFTALGLFCIPALSALRGFFLAFSIASFARAYGQAGIEVAFLLLGTTCLLALPVFFVLASQSFTAAVSLAGRGEGQGKRTLPYHQDYFLRCGLCAAATCVCILLDRYLVPVLVTGAAGLLSQ